MASNNPKTPELPVGYRFRPTELELLKYLQFKVLEKPLSCDGVIKDNVNVYDFQDPEKLFEGSDGDVVYVFTKPKRVCKVAGKRFERQVGDLTWKGSDVGKKFRDEEKGMCIGSRKNFSLRKGGISLGYNMKEYRLHESILRNAKEELKDCVLCAIRRNKSEEKGKSRIENSEENLLLESRLPVRDEYSDTFATSSNNASNPSTLSAKDITCGKLDPKVESPYQEYQQNQRQDNISAAELYRQNQYDQELNELINSYLPLDNQENNATMDWQTLQEPHYEGNPYQESQWPISDEGFFHPGIMGDLASEMAISFPEKNLLHTGPTSQFNYSFLVDPLPMLIDSSEALLTQMVPLAMILPSSEQKPTPETEMEIEKTAEIAPSKITHPAENCEVKQKSLLSTSNEKKDYKSTIRNGFRGRRPQ